jgi:ribosomal protein L11 methyltransferase
MVYGPDSEKMIRASAMPADSALPGNPYAELYIYYLQGQVDDSSVFADSAFVGNWQEDGFSFLFFTRPSEALVSHLVSGHPHLTLLDHYQMGYDQWQGEPVVARRLGNFWVAPPWDRPEDFDATTDILMDPGVVFGTGTHPTTQDCLTAIALAVAEHRVDCALDLGTGTGLLALAAARLGCGRLLALDVNLLAAQTAWANVRRNGLDSRIAVIQGRAQDWIGHPADLVIANIHYAVMKQLIGMDGFWQARRFVLSGLLRSEARAVAETLAAGGAQVRRRWEKDGIWHTFYGNTG